MAADYTEREIAAARELCRLQSEACNTDAGDGWKLYADVFLHDARCILAAADGVQAAGESMERAK